MFQTEYLKSMLIVNQNYKIKLIRCSLATACNCRADRVIASSVSPRQALVLPTRRILPVPSMQTSMRASSQNSEVSSTWKQGQSSHPRKKKRQRRTNKRVIVILYTLRTIYAHTLSCTLRVPTRPQHICTLAIAAVHLCSDFANMWSTPLNYRKCWFRMSDRPDALVAVGREPTTVRMVQLSRMSSSIGCLIKKIPSILFAYRSPAETSFPNPQSPSNSNSTLHCDRAPVTLSTVHRY
jgi:hypothetical protein